MQAGDRVAGYLPNVPEAVAFLGCASIGAVWSACAPDFGTRSVLDRFAQIEPVVLVVVDGYRFAGREHDRRGAVAELRAALPTVRTTIAVPRLPRRPARRCDDLGRGRRRPAAAGVRAAALRRPPGSWNMAGCALPTGATLVVHDRAPGYPTLDAQFAIAARTGITHLGTRAGYLTACEKAALRPGEEHDLSHCG